MSSSSSNSPPETSSALPSGSDAEEQVPYHGPLYWLGWGHFDGVPCRDLTAEEVAQIRPGLVQCMIDQRVYAKKAEPKTVADDPGPDALTPQSEV